MGLTSLDASALIGFLDHSDIHHVGCKQAIRETLFAGDDMIVPVVAYAEVLVGAIRQQGIHAKPLLDVVLASLPARVVAASLDIGSTAAELRARHVSLKLPDAFVIATAIHENASRIVTAARGWPRVHGLTFQIVGPRSK